MARRARTSSERKKRSVTQGNSARKLRFDKKQHRNIRNGNPMPNIGTPWEAPPRMPPSQRKSIRAGG